MINAEKYKKYENVNRDIESIIVEKEKILERKKSLEKEIETKNSRIKVKDEEVNEKMSEIEKLKKQIEDANLNIRNSDFFEQQFDQKKKELDEKTREFNKLVQLTYRQDMDKNELTEEIRILQQEIADVRAEKERAQSKILPPQTLDQMRHDIRNLNKLLDEKEKDLRENRKKIKDLEGDKKNATDNFNRYKETSTRRMERMKEHHEKEIKKLKEKYIKTVKPQDIKAATILLENLGDIEDYDDVNYDDAIGKLRDAREKFKKLIEDPNTPRNKKFLYKEIDEILQYRVDFLNVEVDRPVETSKGNEVLVISERGRFLFLRRILLWIKNNPTSVISIVVGTLSTIVTSAVYYISLYGNKTKTVIVETTKTIVKYVKISAPALAGIAVTAAFHLVDSITWFVKHIYEILIGIIIATITLYKMYGEEMSFPLLSVWSFIIALFMVFLNSIYNYLGY